MTPLTRKLASALRYIDTYFEAFTTGARRQRRRARALVKRLSARAARRAGRASVREAGGS